MPIGTEVGFGSGVIVLDGDPAPRRNGAQQPPLFGPCWVRVCSVYPNTLILTLNPDHVTNYHNNVRTTVPTYLNTPLCRMCCSVAEAE